MISNEDVAGFVAEAPDRLIGVGSVDISKPMVAMREVRRCVESSVSRRFEYYLGFGKYHQPIVGFILSSLRVVR